jgi:hypothetical protein
MLCVSVRTTFYEYCSMLLHMDCASIMSGNWFINFWNDMVVNNKTFTIVLALKKPSCYIQALQP